MRSWTHCLLLLLVLVLVLVLVPNTALAANLRPDFSSPDAGCLRVERSVSSELCRDSSGSWSTTAAECLVAPSSALVSDATSPMTGYTWNQVLQARYGASNVEWVAPQLPKFSGSPTSGVLRTPSGDFDLVSGWGGPATSMPKGSLGFAIVTRTHVEGDAAALMQRQGISEGTLYINNPQICPNCMNNLPFMLSPDRQLNVILPSGEVTPFTGVPR